MAETNEPETVNVFITARMPTEETVTIAVNGVTHKVPTNQWTPVREDMLEAITNSDRAYQIQTRPSDEDGAAVGEGVSAGAGVLADTDKPEGKRDGPDDDHSQPYVDKGPDYQPAAGAAGAEHAQEDAAADAVPKTPLVPGVEDKADAFDANAVLDGNVATVTDRLAALTPEQLEKVKDAENARETTRATVLKAIDAASAKSQPAG